MEHIEKYLHHDLPNLGVRFIGVVDGVDTDNEDNKKSQDSVFILFWINCPVYVSLFNIVCIVWYDHVFVVSNAFALW